MVRFQKEPKQKTSSYNNDLHSRNDRLPNVTYSGNIRGSFASILKEGTKKQSVLNPLQSTLVLDDSFLKERGFYESDEESKFEDKDLDNVKEDSDVEKVSETSGMQENEIGNDNEHSIHREENLHSSDPFNIYELLQKKKDNIHQTKESDPTHPPGFSPGLGNNNKEEGLGHKAKKGWIKELYLMHKINFIAIQETKMENIDLFSINMLWDHVSSSDYFLAIMGTWTPSSTKLLVISVYAPQEVTEKRALWDYLRSLIDRWNGEIVVLGDCNEVRTEQEWFGSTFNIQGANSFNNFISIAGLIDHPLGGYSYTWAHKSASKMSKLDRFLISEGLMELFPHLTGLYLDRHLSNHRPIIMVESKLDYGPIPFCMFHSWFKMEGFDKFVEDTWDSMNVMDSNAIKSWVKEKKNSMNEAKFSIKCMLNEVDKLLDHGEGNDEIRIQRVSLLKDLNDITSDEALLSRDRQ
ncbi:RNA-directed DNA polymerase, eukaryota [Tanacetum coccineum]